ncbi:unnamed protein product [Adineta steineri]|uniref:Uncharacterized protein n=1 Tax=Adineta steineri TaxID=433720 RepID=A0A813QMT6_9BILA|nr:unnamed protein product [Adineta steineri]CAF0768813.1 unnamed protein product [Adineta steineri]CAF0814043.1 unnamed protein product [Adineta steineri]
MNGSEAWIIAAITCGFGVFIQTCYFLVKMMGVERTDYYEETDIRTVDMSKCEVKYCMGRIWTSCLDKATNRMSARVFIIWYLIGLSTFTLIPVIVYLAYRTDATKGV